MILADGSYPFAVGFEVGFDYWVGFVELFGFDEPLHSFGDGTERCCGGGGWNGGWNG